MSDESLTYRSSGVDVEANLEANRRIQAYVRRTYTEQVLSRSGLFGGALGLPDLPEPLEHSILVGRLIVAQGDSPEQVSRQIARFSRSRLAPAARPLAFLDYLAAARMDAHRAADLVGIFSEALAATPPIPIIGGETAEMPDVFQEGAWEVVGAIFGIGEAEAKAEPEAKPEAEAGAEGQVNLSSLQGLEQPALVFSVDGVGTKTKIGAKMRRTSELALDIIHHCLDDILCQGARGIGFMLYIGCHSRDEQLIEPVTAAAAKCCRGNGMVLLDCLITEKPNQYQPGEIDICGAIVGIMDARRLLQGETIRPGDMLLGVLSSGLHTNGYSLARKSLLERGGLALDQHIEELGSTLGEALLEPHRNYAPLILPLLADEDTAGAIKGIAHITGGGLKDNLERILPRRACAEIRMANWQPPPIFQLIRRCGNIPLQDPVGKGMYESFNMGIGLVLVVAPEHCDGIRQRIRSRGQETEVIGRVLACEASSPADGARVEGYNKRSAEPGGRVLLL